MFTALANINLLSSTWVEINSRDQSQASWDGWHHLADWNSEVMNSVSGSIPTELGLVSWLELMNISGNPALSGFVPTELCGRIAFDCSSDMCGCDCSCALNMSLSNSTLQSQRGCAGH